MKKICFFGIGILIALLFIIMVTGEKDKDFSKGSLENITYEVTNNKTNLVQLIINNEDVVLIELYEDKAPITVENFKVLVNNGYYDGLEFHRIIKDFMVQGGNGANADSIVGEFSQNGYTNEIKHLEGTISMARTNEVNSASSQFFICLNDTGCAHLDGAYAAFGKVIAGMDSIKKLGIVKTDSNDKPLEKQIITSINFVDIKE